MDMPALSEALVVQEAPVATLEAAEDTPEAEAAADTPEVEVAADTPEAAVAADTPEAEAEEEAVAPEYPSRWVVEDLVSQ